MTEGERGREGRVCGEGEYVAESGLVSHRFAKLDYLTNCLGRNLRSLGLGPGSPRWIHGTKASPSDRNNPNYAFHWLPSCKFTVLFRSIVGFWPGLIARTRLGRVGPLARASGK